MRDPRVQPGHSPANEVRVVTDPPVSDGDSARPQAPLSARWITPALLHRTQEVWARAYGRPVSPDEAVEILTNVKHFAEVLQRVDRRTE